LLLSQSELGSSKEMCQEYLSSDTGYAVESILNYSHAFSVQLLHNDSSNQKSKYSSMIKEVKEMIDEDPELFKKLSYK